MERVGSSRARIRRLGRSQREAPQLGAFEVAVWSRNTQGLQLAVKLS